MAELLSRARRISPEQLRLCVALTSLQLTPGTRALKLGMGDSLVVAALAEATGAPADDLKSELRQLGDLGDLAATHLANLPPSSPPLTLREASDSLLELAATSGTGASGDKTTQLAAVLRRAMPLEAKYVVRSIRGKLRAGLGDRSLRAALAQAAMVNVHDPSVELAAAVTKSDF